MFDMNDPDNRKALMTGLIIGESLNESRKDGSGKSSPDEVGGSPFWYLVGILLSVIIIVVAYIVLMD